MPREVGLAHELPVAELVGRLLAASRPRALRRAPRRPRASVERSRRRVIRRAASRSSSDEPWNGMPASCSSSSKSVSRAFVRARIAISSSGSPRRRICRDDRGAFVLGRRVRAHDRLVAVGQRRAQRLLGAAEVRDELVRERKHLRRRAVVLLEAHDERLREPARARRAGAPGPAPVNAVDRLVVVADDAEVVAVAEPEVEQRLLQQVDVLVLVDREGAVLRAERRRAHRRSARTSAPQLEQILEVDQPLGRLPPLVLAEDAQHQVDRDRRLASVRLGRVALRPRCAGSSPTRSRSRGRPPAGT